jgi:hypothetical protein
MPYGGEVLPAYSSAPNILQPHLNYHKGQHAKQREDDAGDGGTAACGGKDLAQAGVRVLILVGVADSRVKGPENMQQCVEQQA